MAQTIHEIRTLRVDAAIAEYLEAIERGTPPDCEAFLRVHSDVAPEVREFLADYQALKQAAPRHASIMFARAPTMDSGLRDKIPAPNLPCTFGHFELLEEIARGGMGVVYKARQSTPTRIVALKMILAGRLAAPSEVERFHAEAQAAAALDHPNIVPVFEVGEVEGQTYFTMGYVAGQSVAERIAAGPLPVREAALIIREAASAVDYAHRQGVFHRDLKPGNILVDDRERVRITDFGLAKRKTDDAGLTKTGHLLGTPNYMPPELLTGESGDIGPECDVYSLGATLYALLTGRPPFQAASVADVLRQVADKEPAMPRELDLAIPRDLETIALKCLEKSPSRRYASAQALADDLERFLADRPIVARRSTAWERLVRWRRRNPLVAGLVAAVATLLVLAITTLAASNGHIRRQSAARASALKQKDVALITARNAVNQMLTEVANKKFSDVPIAHPLRIALLQDALRFYESLAPLAAADQSVASEMAGVLGSMALLHRELGQRDEAIRSLRRGIKLLTTAPEPRSRRLSELLAKLELHLAYTMGESVQSEAADPAVESQYRRALTLLRDLERRTPGRPQDRVLCLRYLAERAIQRGNRAEAEELWREAIANGEACLAQDPMNVDARISLCWAHVEFYNRLLRDSAASLHEATQLMSRALEHAQVATEQGDYATSARAAAASIRLCLATTYCRAGRADQAICLYRQAIDDVQSLCADSPWTESYWHTLSWFHDDLMANLRIAGREDEGREALKRFSAWILQMALKIPAEPVPQELYKQTRQTLVEQLRAAGLGLEADELIGSAE